MSRKPHSQTLNPIAHVFSLGLGVKALGFSVVAVPVSRYDR